MNARHISVNELNVLHKILMCSTGSSDYIAQLDKLLVEQLDDAGSLRFVSIDDPSKPWPRPHRFVDAKGVVIDYDGIPVLLCPFEDESGALYMLDVQKMGGGSIGVDISAEKIRVEQG